ncbi:phenylacetate-CoA oxygenase subunit PaaI [Arthrobacter crystallopoietes BAB-32]|uniref:Phenylacetate-CoA oxygenase subunit PaaI n=1 Tax=Arthrobacter crystallopoietes BAB-32 TaxID=1246476 RepID=N1UVZ5_9MICC|nr:1,2-phenylacetyl-CoA epoxidase subunit PaaC [Arthrobacter crystallopoietes]EMY34576.1 phenylacetate-CoA oxygenase subunit PaaI [Arthrobacter crystallopoietes BAB-32]
MSGESATRITPGNAYRPEDVAAQVAEGVEVSEDVAEYALRLGDDALILAQRLGWWISRAPELEEDVALANIALDLIGHARSFLTYAGAAWGKSEDDLAYWRGENEFRSSYLVEQPNGDFGKTIARQLVFSAFQHELYSRLVDSADATLAAIAAKALKEVDYHRDHATQWTLRLGDGTEESKRRMAAGLVSVWPYVDQLFQDDDLVGRLEGVAVRPSELRAPFDAYLAGVFAEAGLELPDIPPAMTDKSRHKHSEHLGYLLAEMQVLAREHPGATW